MRLKRRTICLILLAGLGAWMGWRWFSNYALDFASSHYLANGVVRVELAGQRFNIPVSYMYWEGFVKHEGRWPRPLPGRTVVSVFNFDVLLPDLRPYREADGAKWSELGPGDRMAVYVRSPLAEAAKFPEGRFYNSYQAKLDDLKEGFSVRLPDQVDLIQFQELTQKSPTNPEKKVDSLVFFTKDLNTIIRCYTDDPHPGCNISSKSEDKFEFSYSYSYKYINNWKEIHRKTLELIYNFYRSGLEDQI